MSAQVSVTLYGNMATFDPATKTIRIASQGWLSESELRTLRARMEAALRGEPWEKVFAASEEGQ